MVYAVHCQIGNQCDVHNRTDININVSEKAPRNKTALRLISFFLLKCEQQVQTSFIKSHLK